MSVPTFLHIYQNGHVYHTNDVQFNAPEGGAIVGIFKVNCDGAAQQITVLSGTVGSTLAVTGATGKNGKEIS